MKKSVNIGMLGAGKMACALAEGFLRSGLTRPENLMAGDIAEGARSQFQSVTGGRTAALNAEVVDFADVLVIAVKPAQVEALLEEIRDTITPHHLVVSIAAGVSVRCIEQRLSEGCRVVRVMPNTPALVGCGASGYSLGKWATSEDGRLIHDLLAAVGLAVAVEEPLLDAVTGLSGSGPAFVFLMIEALSDGGVAAGLPREVATRLAAQTLAGAARMVLETGRHPGELKDMVTSPGGTTIAGLRELENSGCRGALMRAVEAAAARSRELGRT